jgi:hypothetical protein
MSLTSRSVEQGVSMFSGDEDELEHGTLWHFVKSFVAAAGSCSYSQQNDDEMTDDEEGKEESNDESDTGRGREEKQQDEQDNEEKDAVDDDFPMYMIDVDQLLDDDPNYIDEVIHHLLGVEYSDEQVMSVLRTLGAMTSVVQTANQASSANRKKLEAWLNLPALLCPVYFQRSCQASNCCLAKVQIQNSQRPHGHFPK